MSASITIFKNDEHKARENEALKERHVTIDFKCTKI